MLELLSMWVHVKTGHIYAYQGECCIEKECVPAVFYNQARVKDGDPRLWVRPLEEFMDGRFKLIRCRSDEFHQQMLEKGLVHETYTVRGEDTQGAGSET